MNNLNYLTIKNRTKNKIKYKAKKKIYFEVINFTVKVYFSFELLMKNN